MSFYGSDPIEVKEIQHEKFIESVGDFLEKYLKNLKISYWSNRPKNIDNTFKIKEKFIDRLQEVIDILEDIKVLRELQHWKVETPRDIINASKNIARLKKIIKVSKKIKKSKEIKEFSEIWKWEEDIRQEEISNIYKEIAELKNKNILVLKDINKGKEIKKRFEEIIHQKEEGIEKLKRIHCLEALNELKKIINTLNNPDDIKMRKETVEAVKAIKNLEKGVENLLEEKNQIFIEKFYKFKSLAEKNVHKFRNIFKIFPFFKKGFTGKSSCNSSLLEELKKLEKKSNISIDSLPYFSEIIAQNPSERGSVYSVSL
ncbi:MAG: hypothetical protein V4700_02545 [Pseudomonadota bacterium]